MLSAGQLQYRYDKKVSSQTLDQWTKNNKLLTDKRIDNKYNKCNYTGPDLLTYFRMVPLTHRLY